MWASLALLALVTFSLSFLTGALQTGTGPEGWRLSAHDSRGTRRFSLTLRLSERPDIAFFNASGQRFDPSHLSPEGWQTP